MRLAILSFFLTALIAGFAPVKPLHVPKRTALNAEIDRKSAVAGGLLGGYLLLELGYGYLNSTKT